MRRHSDNAGGPHPPIFLGLRARLLAALVFTAAATLAAAALALLTPLESQLRSNTLDLTKAQVSAIKSALGGTALDSGSTIFPRQLTYEQRIDHVADVEVDSDHLGSLIVWWHVGGTVVPFDFTDRREDRHASPALAIRAYAAQGSPVHQELGGVLSVAARYRAPGPSPAQPAGIRYVVQVFKPVDYLGTANSVVRSAFLVAALVGLAVALLLGIALTSRLLRRLRVLQDASRNLDEEALGTLVVPHERFSDEIGELARAFTTMYGRLRQQEDARRAFVATASHELRTPLASLDGLLELLADDLGAEPIDLADARIRVASAQLQSRRLSGLATDLLDLSRLDAALELRSEPVELAETARAVAAEFDARARERGVAVVLDEVGAQSWALADPGSVARIVRILLDNALRVAPSASMVEIRIGDRSGLPAIEVSDEGPGVPAEDHALIFERFQRGRTRSDESGFGLGLAIGSELATKMGGSLELTEETPGATFRLTLPGVEP